MQGFTVAARTDVDTISSLPDCEDIIDKIHQQQEPTAPLYFLTFLLATKDRLY